jgi:hypothetical protein
MFYVRVDISSVSPRHGAAAKEHGDYLNHRIPGASSRRRK